MMRKNTLFFLAGFFVCLFGSVYGQSKVIHSTKWVVTKPFERDVFIQNKGQFTEKQLNDIKNQVLYYTMKGRLKIYYALDGLIFEYDSIVHIKNSEGPTPKPGTEEAAEQDKKDLRTKHYFVKMQWLGANPNPNVEVQNKVSDYFTYSNLKDKTGKSGITAYGFNNLIYRNLYKGIDVEFYYPKEKGGLEYAVIVHPGADISAFKMHYSGATAMLTNRKIKILSLAVKGLTLTDHAPQATDIKGNSIPISFKMQNNTISFSTGKYNKNNTLTIDPWITATSFTPTNGAYDLDYDVNGNVYIYGGGATTEYQEKKYNNLGVLQWTYTSTMPYIYGGSYYFYGGMVADERTGTTYICEGFDPTPGCYVIKINANGSPIATNAGTSGIDEMWHMAFDYCYNELLYATGGGANDVAYGDTNLTAITGVDIYGGNVVDETLLNTDRAGNCYLGSCQMIGAPTWANYISKGVLPAFSPVPYQIYDKHDFIEITNVSYYPIISPYAAGNGFNGLAANSKIYVTYDGATARIWRASNGNLIDSVKPSLTPYAWGGLDLDCESNLYCGNNNSISMYDSSGNSLGTIPLSNTVYALRWDPRGLVYACGNGFVQAVSVGVKMAKVTVVPSGSCSCNGSATADACGNGPFTYSWSNGVTTSSITGLCAGSYTVTITGSGCFPRKDTAIAVILGVGGGGLSAVTTQTNVKCNGGATGTASVSVSGGTSPYTYLWSPGGSTTSAVTGLTAGTYTCISKDAGGCTDTALFVITQPPVLTASITAVINIKCNGSATGQATATATGGTGGTYTYMWTPSGGTNAIASNLSAGSYTVTVHDSNGCTATASTILTQPTALTNNTSLVQATCNVSNGSVADTVKNGTPGYTYLWSNGQTTSDITGLSVGTYTVTATDANGCTITTSVNVTDAAAETVTITNVTNLLCYGNNNGVITTNTTGGTTPYTYAWTPSGGTNANATGLSAGTYTVTVTDANGCVFIADTIITQPTALQLTAAGFPVSCYGGNNGQATVIPSGGTGVYAYSWTPSGGTNANANNLSAGTYTVTVTDANGCTHDTAVVVSQPAQPRDSISASVNILCNGNNNGKLTVGVIGGTTPYTYLWSPSGGGSATASNLTAGSYTITVTDANGCIVTTSATLTQPATLTIADTVSTICVGNPVTLSPIYSGGTPSYTYSWIPAIALSCTTCPNPVANPTVTTVYTLTLTDANGCTTTQTDTVKVAPPLNITASPSQSMCPGDSAHLTSLATGGNGVYSYTWLPAIGLQCATCQNTTASPSVTTTYSVIVNDGCSTPPDTATTTVVINPLPVISFSADTANGCAPVCTMFKNNTTISSGTISSWLWNFGDGDTTAQQSPYHCFTTPGNYTVSLTATSNKGCTDTVKVNNMISVYSYPVAAFSLAPQPTTITNPTIYFTDKSTDAYGPIAAWLWTFGDMGDVPSTAQNPNHTYQDTGTFCAELTVTNLHGCKDSITECLVIGPQFTLYIPDAFSPNGDGIDDLFFAKGDFVHNFKMYIFDRWGMMLYHTDDIRKGWNGTVNGGSILCQEDTYIYMITCQDNLGNQHSYIGKVTLVK